MSTEADTCRTTYFRNSRPQAGKMGKQRRIVIYLNGLPPIGDLRQTKVNALRGLQSATGEELDALMPSILDKAFKGEL